MATHSSIFAWKIPWTGEPGGLQPMEWQRVRHDWLTNTHTHTSEYSLEGLMLKLKLQYFGHLMQRADSLEKTLMMERLKAGEGDDKSWDDWVASLTQWTWVWASSNRWWWTEKPALLLSMALQRVRHNWATEQHAVLVFPVINRTLSLTPLMGHRAWHVIQLIDICLWSPSTLQGTDQINAQYRNHEEMML